MSLASLSVAVAVVTAVVFSATEKAVVASPSNVGAAFAAVVALPVSDQGLVPSSFVARTCT